MIDLGAMVGDAFKILGNTVQGAVRTVTYRTAGEQTYDTVTGNLTTSSVSYTIKATFIAYKREERDGDMQNSRRVSIELGDQKCLIPYTSLPITPSMEDRIIDGANTWRIIEIKIDPTGKALHTLQLRQA